MGAADFSALRTVAVILVVFYVLLRLLLWRAARTGPTRPDGPFDFVAFGASLIGDGYHYFPDWSACMNREFDDIDNSALEYYYELSKSVAEHPREEWAERIQDELKG